MILPPFAPRSLSTSGNFTTIPPGGVRTMAVVVHVLPDTLGMIFSDAEVSSATLDTNAFNNPDNYPVTVFAEADVSVGRRRAPTRTSRTL